MNEQNEYGFPLHACWGYRHDGHYWAWVRQRCRLGLAGPVCQALVLAADKEPT